MGLFDRLRKKKNIETEILPPPVKQKIAICFGGGGARGFTHVGAVKALEEAGITFDMCVGTSVGSLVGAFYAAGVGADDLINYCESIDMKEIHSGKIWKPGDPHDIGKIFYSRMGNLNIENLALPFACVAVDLVTGKQVIMDKGSVTLAISASCAVPLVFKPVISGKLHLVDGGVLNNIPSVTAKMMGADKVVTFDCNPTRGGGTAELGIFDVLKATFNIMSAGASVEGLVNSDLIVSFNTKKYSSMKKDGYKEMIELGYEATRAKINEIKKITGSNV